MSRPPRKTRSSTSLSTDEPGICEANALTDRPTDASNDETFDANLDANPDIKLNSTRRNVLHGMLAAAASALIGSVSMRALAQTSVTSPDVALDAFMSLSNALTARNSLDRTVGARLLTAVAKGQTAFNTALPGLAAALNAGNLTIDQQQLAWRIMEGWYLGVVDNVVITYEQALMFDVVYDTPVIRSYAPGKPGFWAQKPHEKNA